MTGAILLAIMLSVALSAVVCVMFRRFDKDQKTLEKLKRYADMRQEEFDKYFRGRADELTVLKSDLDTTQVKASATVRALKQEQEQFEQDAKDLSKPIEAVARIEEQLSAYDKVIRNLMQMTAAVEENLQKVKNEADIIESFVRYHLNITPRFTETYG